MKASHVHILSALWPDWEALSKRAHGEGRAIRVLDAGCGYGGLIRDLDTWSRRSFAAENRARADFFGYEVTDHRGATPGFFETTTRLLSESDAKVDWQARLRVADAREPWPFEDGFFDLVVSNQVLEHARDLDHFFQQVQRVTNAGGRAFHFFPAGAIVREPHCGVPLAHWLRPGPTRLRWIRGWSRLGVGKFLSYRKARGQSLNGFAAEFEKYLSRYVYFRSTSAVLSLAERHSLAAGYCFDAKLLRRTAGDDWEPFSYGPRRLRRWAGLSPFSSTLLAQEF